MTSSIHPTTGGWESKDSEGLSASVPVPPSSQTPSSAIDPTYVGGRRSHSAGPSSHPNSVSSSGDSNSTPDTSSKKGQHGDLPHGMHRYEQIQEIGRGGCGVVFRAYDRQLDRVVVIKKILKQQASHETQNRFLNEAKITGQLSHPGIVPVYEIGKEEDTSSFFYAMKWLHGETLAMAMHSYMKMSQGVAKSQRQRELLNRFHQVCLTLAYAHNQKVIHRDLKPANVILGEFGETVVLDWGLAKKLETHTSSIDACIPQANEPFPPEVATASSNAIPSMSSVPSLLHTMQGTVQGTAAYMSPEQARGENATLSFPSDVFSLGCILYEILCERSPFRAATIEETMERVRRAEMVPPRSIRRGIHRSLEAICLKCLQLQPENRYASADELANDVHRFLNGSAVEAYQEPWWIRVDRLADKHRILVRSSVAALFFIAITAIASTTMVLKSLRSESAAKSLAQRESHDRHIALRASQKAQQVTFEQLQQTRASVDAWLIDLSGSLQFFPGLQPIRDHLLEQAREYYSHSIDLSINNATIDLEHAKASIRLGDIARLQEDACTARDHYCQAFQTLHSASPANTEDRNEFAIQQLNTSLGLILCDLMEDLNTSILEDSAIRLQSQAEQVLAISPSHREAQNAFARALLVQARIFYHVGKLERSIQATEHARPVAMEMWERTHDSRDSQLLSQILQEGSFYRNCMHLWSDAAEWNAQLAKIYSLQLASHRQRPDWIEARGQAHIRHGNALLRNGDHSSALHSYEQAKQDLLDSWQIVADETTLHENLAIVETNVGLAKFRSGDVHSSQKHFQSAVDQLRSVIVSQGSTPSRILRMAELYLWQACSIDNLPSEDRAQWLGRAHTLLQHLDQQPSPAIDIQNLKLLHRALLAQTFLCECKPADALQTYLEGCEMLVASEFRDADTLVREEAKKRLEAVFASLIFEGYDCPLPE
ncbi:MAG: serine/threonine-protein kinase [Pirellulales bacterium]